MSTPTLVFSDSPRVRCSDPVTSHEAADRNNHFDSRALVATVLEDRGPLADHELTELLAGIYTPQRIRTARHELTETGLVEFAGYYRLTPTRHRARVWQTVRRTA